MSKTTTHHLSLSVRGALNWPRAEQRRALKWLTQDDGTPFPTVDAMRDALMDELAQGHEVIPCSKACDNFDYKTGCRGHVEEPTNG